MHTAVCEYEKYFPFSSFNLKTALTNLALLYFRSRGIIILLSNACIICVLSLKPATLIYLDRFWVK